GRRLFKEEDGEERINDAAREVWTGFDRTHERYIATALPAPVAVPFARTISADEIDRDQIYATAVATDDDGRFDRGLEFNILRGGEGKSLALDDIESRYPTGVSPFEHPRSVAGGDSIGDLPMFRRASNAIIVDPGVDTVEEWLGQYGDEVEGGQESRFKNPMVHGSIEAVRDALQPGGRLHNEVIADG
ncbi:MAG: hypothetical protein ABEK12_03920, partial [Candidatus Nanohaloarchaea archaeon]